MAIGKEIERRSHIIGFREEIDAAAAQSKDTFFTWFDNAENADAAFIRGGWDFSIHIAQPLASLVSSPESKAILEIGYGGGRLLAAAARHFGEATGVDIHNQTDRVLEELHLRGVMNVKALQGDGVHIPCEDASIDVAYSFIVLQHVEKVAIFHQYLREIFRTLRPGGVALVYVGRFAPLSENRSSRLLYMLDRCVESLWLWRGYKEVAAKVNCTNLYITPRYACHEARSVGFEIKGRTVSWKQVPDGYGRYGGQTGVLLQKPTV